MKINKSKPSHWWALIRFTAVCCAAFVKHRLFGEAARKPIVLLYGHKLNSNLKALYQALEKESEAYDFYFLTIDKQYHLALKKQNISALYACSASTIKTIANTSVIVSDHGLHCLELFLGRSDIKFMDVWHGLPFKGFDGDDFKVQRKYDAVCVTSRYIKTLYTDEFGFHPKKIKITGYGRTDLLLQPYPKDIYEANQIPEDDRKLILYAPTWNHDHNHQEVPFGLDATTFLERLNVLCSNNNARLVIRTHLNSSYSVTDDYDFIVFRPHTNFPDTEAILQITNILICDWSSIALDFLVLKRPILYIDCQAPFKKLSSLVRYRKGDICRNFEHLEEILQKRLTESKVDHGREILELYDDNTQGNSGKNYVKTISNLLSIK